MFVGWGFWKGAGWAWTSGVILEILGVIGGIITVPYGLIIVLICGLILYYLFKPNVKAWFSEVSITKGAAEVPPSFFEWARVPENEKAIFFTKLTDRLRDLKTFSEKIEITEESEEQTPEGASIVHVCFTHHFGDNASVNDLVGVKEPGEHFYRIRLKSKIAKLGTPETFINRTIERVRDILQDIIKEH